MLQFEKDGVNALSTEHNEHVEMLLNTKYSYIVETASAAEIMSQHCGVTVAKERFGSIFYTIPLQKDSAYTKLVNDA